MAKTFAATARSMMLVVVVVTSAVVVVVAAPAAVVVVSENLCTLDELRNSKLQNLFSYSLFRSRSKKDFFGKQQICDIDNLKTDLKQTYCGKRKLCHWPFKKKFCSEMTASSVVSQN